MRYTNDGDPVCNFTMAVTRGYGKYERTDYIPVVVWGKRGKAAAKHLSKGRQVIVNGSLQIRKNKKNGRTYTNPEIIANNVKFIYSSKKNKNQNDETDDIPEETTQDTKEDPLEDEDDFEVPF